MLTSYLVSSAIVLPISGWLSSVIGRKRFYMRCVALFTGVLFCAAWRRAADLIVARIFQGRGGGGLQPSEQAILADNSLRKSAAWRSPCMAWPWWSRLRSDPH